MGNKKPVENTEKKTPDETIEKINPVENTEKAPPLTTEEHAIAARVSKPQSDWENIKEEEMVDFSLSVDAYALPEEAQLLQNNKKFAFRFIAMTKKRIDQVTNWPHPARWEICNRNSHPELSKYFDPVHGAFQKEDQIMVYKPWAFHMRYQESKAKAAELKDQSRSLASKKDRIERRADGSTRVEYKVGEEHKIGGTDVVMQEV